MVTKKIGSQGGNVLKQRKKTNKEIDTILFPSERSSEKPDRLIFNLFIYLYIFIPLLYIFMHVCFDPKKEELICLATLPVSHAPSPQCCK